MTLIVVFLLSCLSLVIWLVLLFGRGGFWRARAARRLPPDARGAAAEKEEKGIYIQKRKKKQKE